MYRPESLAKEGFIHFSLEEQWPVTRERFYKDKDDLVLMTVDPQRLKAPLKLEEGEPGQLFPHLYGELNLDAVVSTRRV